MMISYFNGSPEKRYEIMYSYLYVYAHYAADGRRVLTENEMRQARTSYTQTVTTQMASRTLREHFRRLLDEKYISRVKIDDEAVYVFNRPARNLDNIKPVMMRYILITRGLDTYGLDLYLYLLNKYIWCRNKRVKCVVTLDEMRPHIGAAQCREDMVLRVSLLSLAHEGFINVKDYRKMWEETRYEIDYVAFDPDQLLPQNEEKDFKLKLGAIFFDEVEQ